jgi:hypothetical protein
VDLSAEKLGQMVQGKVWLSFGKVTIRLGWVSYGLDLV